MEMTDGLQPKKTCKGIDIAKFTMAVFILILHTNPLMDVSKVLEWGSRCCITVLAVPFFFIANGYFALSSDMAAKKSIRKLALLYVIWSIIYLPFSLLKLSDAHNLSVGSYLHSFFIYGSYDTIWYLSASAVGVTAVWLLKKYCGIFSACVVMAFFHVAALLGTSYAGLIEKCVVWNVYDHYYRFFVTFKNGLFFGGIYIALGGLIRESLEKKMVSKFSSGKLAAAVCVLLGMLVMEAAGCKFLGIDTHGVDMKIMLVPLSVCLFVLLLNWEVQISDQSAIFLRKMSILIFLTQRIFLKGFELLGLKEMHSLIWFLIVSAATIAFSYVILRLSQRWKFLGFIY